MLLDGRVSPIAVKMSHINFKFDEENGARNEILNLTDYIGVANLRHLSCTSHNDKIRFDLTHCLRLGYLSLDRAEIDGWNNRLILHGFRFVFPLEAALDLSDLPLSI